MIDVGVLSMNMPLRILLFLS